MDLKQLKAKWDALPKQKWIAVAVVAVLLAIAADAAFSQDEANTLWIGGSGGLIIGCNPRLNEDGIHVCAAAHSGQRGYCIPIPEGRLQEAGEYYCTGNQPGNKTYDKALLIKAMVDDPSKSVADIDAATEAWDVKHPPQVSTGM